MLSPILASRVPMTVTCWRSVVYGYTSGGGKLQAASFERNVLRSAELLLEFSPSDYNDENSEVSFPHDTMKEFLSTRNGSGSNLFVNEGIGNELILKRLVEPIEDQILKKGCWSLADMLDLLKRFAIAHGSYHVLKNGPE